MLRAQVMHVFWGKIFAVGTQAEFPFSSFPVCISFMGHQILVCWNSGNQSMWLFLPYPHLPGAYPCPRLIMSLYHCSTLVTQNFTIDTCVIV